MSIPKQSQHPNTAELQARDQRHVWHPYSATPAPFPALPIASARGVWLRTTDGRQLIDGMSSWWAACHGHGHPALREAAHRQIDTMSHVMFGGLTHEPAVALAEQLVALARPERASDHPARGDLERVFFSDSGSVSVEVAVKMALQFQRGAGHPERTKLLTWRSGYHGDAFAPMSVCDPEGGMHSLWRGVIAEQIFAPAPPTRGAGEEANAAYLEAMDSMVTDEVAGIIIEPVVQGAGGMRFHDPALVSGVRRICDRHGLVMIADEIATGFGRTGELFATKGAGVTPDIMCVGKALTGGFMSLAATLATDQIADTIQTQAGGGVLMHGPTFMGNPLACAVAGSSVGLIRGGYWRTTVPRISEELLAGLKHLGGAPGVADVRVLGAIGVVEMEHPVDMRATTEAIVSEGVWLRPFGKLIYAMPPFVSTPEEVQCITRAMAAGVRANQEGKQ